MEAAKRLNHRRKRLLAQVANTRTKVILKFFVLFDRPAALNFIALNSFAFRQRL